MAWNNDKVRPAQAGSGPAPADQAGQAIQQLRDRQVATDRRNARWARIAGVVIMVAAAIRIGVSLLPASAKDCDDPEVRSSVLDIFNKQYKAAGTSLQITGLAGIAKVNSSYKLNTCSATAQFNDREAVQVSYEVTPRQVKARLAAVR